MASEDRPAADHLTDLLVRDARAWSFFQAVEQTQRVYDDGTEVGTHLLPTDEKIVFGVDSRLGFPVSDINDIVREEKLPEDDRDVDDRDKAVPTNDLERLRMEVTFLGLHGAGSPLPSYYQETIARYDAEGSLLKGFFDFFHNRLVGLMHRTMRKYRYYVRYRPAATDSFSQAMFCIFGLADREAREQSPINWARLLTFTGLLASRNRSPQVVSSVVSHAFFHPDVEVEEWVRRKVDIPAEQQFSLGRLNSVLGESAVIGERVPDIASKFNVYLKNLGFERFQEFLPRGSSHQALKQLIEFMLRDQHAYDIKLGLAAGEAKPLCLHGREEISSDEVDGYRSHLGWSSFLGTGEASRRDVRVTGRL
ncbi:type VI secretion system baseplate subunit TssG [Martelella mangrovi]|uniref:Type VI secretion system protein ImpH n=1 Tax=Martelella mangrovi TaxID=1397477 RepID=A0ABV2IDG9_9HYPH